MGADPIETVAEAIIEKLPTEADRAAARLGHTVTIIKDIDRDKTFACIDSTRMVQIPPVMNIDALINHTKWDYYHQMTNNGWTLRFQMEKG